MNARSVSIRAGRRSGITKTMGAACMMAAMLDCATAQPYERPTLKRGGSVSEGHPDLQGLWQVFDPRDPNNARFSFNISQSGVDVTMKLVRSGKPELVAFEGTFESGQSIAGNAFDVLAHPDNPQPRAAKITVLGADRIELGGTAIVRATPVQAAIFNEKIRLSFQKLPDGPFDLSGTWSFEDGYRVLIGQDNGELTMAPATAAQMPYFKGRYTSNPEIIGQGWTKGATVDNQKWTETRIVVDDPDHIWYLGRLLYRFSEPKSRDVGCDARNTNHVSGYFADVRGRQAAAAKDFKTAVCWFIVGSKWQYAPAQSMLAAIIIDGKGDAPRDYAVALDLASKSAEQGDAGGQLELAAMYREGKGTTPDPEKAQYWLDKAKESHQLDQLRAMMTPENLANSLSIVGSMVGGMVDFNLTMMPPGCFSQALGNKPTHDCMR